MRLFRTANSVATVLAFGLAAVAPLAAQQATQPEPAVARLVAEPSRINLKVGDSVAFKVTAYDAKGAVLKDAAVRIGRLRHGPNSELPSKGSRGSGSEAR
jgi:hypothetical protein